MQRPCHRWVEVDRYADVARRNLVRFEMVAVVVGTALVADNVVRDGEVADGSSADPSVRGIHAFFDAVAAEPRLRVTAIQTVGVKGYDGFALAPVG